MTISNDKVMFVKHDGIGEGELGIKLLAGFMAQMADQPVLPQKIFFVNRGVLCTTQNGAVLDALKVLENKGVEIYSCATCLEFFGISDQLLVGKAGNAKDTLFSLINSQNAITL